MTTNPSDDSDDSNSLASFDLEEHFANVTSCHGMIHIFDHKTSFLRRYVWGIATFAAFTACIIGCINLLHNLLSHPTNISVKIHHTNKMLFPAVTLCNFNQFSRTLISRKDIRHLDTVLSAYNHDHTIPKEDLKEAEDYFKSKIHGHFDFSQYNQELGLQKEDLILSCTWNGEKCGSKNFSRVFTSYGNCYTFNGGSANHPLLNQHGRGAAHGLSLILNIEQYKYTPELMVGAPNVGIRCSIHYYKSLPRMESQGIAIPPGAHAYAAIPGTEVTNYQKKPWGQCGEKKLKYYKYYSMSACLHEDETLFAETTCQCRDPRLPGNEKACTPIQMLECLIPAMSRYREQDRNLSSCPEVCERVEYVPQVSYAKIPAKIMAEEIASKYNLHQVHKKAIIEGGIVDNSTSVKQFIRDNLVFLDIFFKNLYNTTTTQARDASFSQFLSNVGGQIGLFIGGSFLTLLEIVEYIFDKLAQQRSRYRHKTSQIEKAEWKKIYASSMIVPKTSYHNGNANHPPPYERTLVQMDECDSTEGFLNGPNMCSQFIAVIVPDVAIYVQDQAITLQSS
ncbi:uncharacterized protein TRIADDRAFT_58139 [Trichoplax adhaerens]|uniref:Uncharacterized protein n=1 Tax=Trichoplax adhaerens TaxID=10228 RepID=B3S0Z4_TRIAD|nr:hypothetical protein TRIADDRAFT_58139 [Trichoplax adhaerens]EDV23148.1 hypothetical protein TRIADDRAFT_58139 [Trichoplax adhaerens]|eukprot:XP_002114058.1 hypothetical protein TRIADDRAFT_58139 [Trichoplax adhaerens]